MVMDHIKHAGFVRNSEVAVVVQCAGQAGVGGVTMVNGVGFPLGLRNRAAGDHANVIRQGHRVFVITTRVAGGGTFIHHLHEIGIAIGFQVQALCQICSAQAIHAHMDYVGDRMDHEFNFRADGGSELVLDTDGVATGVFGGEIMEGENGVGLAGEVGSAKAPLVRQRAVAESARANDGIAAGDGQHPGGLSMKDRGGVSQREGNGTGDRPIIIGDQE